MEEVSGNSAVIDRLEMDSVYVLRVRGCNKAGYGEYSEEVYLHTPPAPGENTHTHTYTIHIYTHPHNLSLFLTQVTHIVTIHTAQCNTNRNIHTHPN